MADIRLFLKMYLSMLGNALILLASFIFYHRTELLQCEKINLHVIIILGAAQNAVSASGVIALILPRAMQFQNDGYHLNVTDGCRCVIIAAILLRMLVGSWYFFTTYIPKINYSLIWSDEISQNHTTSSIHINASDYRYYLRFYFCKVLNKLFADCSDDDHEGYLRARAKVC